MYTQLQNRGSERPPVNLSTLLSMKQRGEKIACLTAYDASLAALVDLAGADVVLVGDSLGMVIQGHDTTVPVTMDDMVYHCAAVARGTARPLLMADLPFMSFASPELALRNAVRLMQEGGASMLKLESGPGQLDTVAHLARHDIAVCAHLGLRPQSVHKTGGFRVQGRGEAAAQCMQQDALALEQAGADLLLLECIPRELGRRIAQAASVPVIGIGAGPDTDGQILVLYDILDLTPGRKPRFARNFMAGSESPQVAIARYVQAVKSGEYPASEHCF
jgi:3-methyl-2-oxobutanoate hydroxymethyltransferase